MKSILILILALALAGGAFLSRPSHEDFNKFITQSRTKADGNIFQKGWDEYQAKQFAESCDYKDRFLWVDVQKNGKTVYTGAFNHWFSRDAVSDAVKKIEKK